MFDVRGGEANGRSDAVAFLATVPLLDGVPPATLEALARVLRRREVAAGEVLWREGDEAEAMLLVVDGRVSVSLRLPGDRAVEVSARGRRARCSARCRCSTAAGTRPRRARASRRACSRSVARTSPPSSPGAIRPRSPSSDASRGVACARLRQQLAGLAASLGGGAAAEVAAAAPADLEFCGAPNSAYVRRFATFRAFDSLALWGFLTAGRFARCPAGRTLVAEGSRSPACYLTINGAVEKVIVRGGRRIRVGLAGPGQAFGYESLIDGGPSPVTAATRERTLLLVLPQEAFERLFNGETNISHVFLDVIHRDLMAALRQALRPHARLASSL